MCVHGVTAAILVFQNNETAALLVFQTNPVRVQLCFCVNNSLCSNRSAWLLDTSSVCMQQSKDVHQGRLHVAVIRAWCVQEALLLNDQRRSEQETNVWVKEMSLRRTCKWNKKKCYLENIFGWALKWNQTQITLDWTSKTRGNKTCTGEPRTG